jgi:hypothetical protein
MSIPQQALIHICNQNEELVTFNHPVFCLPDYSESRTQFNGQDLSSVAHDKMVVKMKIAAVVACSLTWDPGHCVRSGVPRIQKI